MNSFTLLDADLPLRTPPQPLELRQENYDQVFDFETLIYDCIYNEKKLVIITPPLSEIELEAVLNNVVINSLLLSSYNYQVFSRDRAQTIIVHIADIVNIEIFKRPITFDMSLTQKATSKVLYTLQKNNDIQWIIDWANYYYLWHTPSLIIIYDNNSDQYSISELQAALEKYVSCKCIVRSFPFRYGAGGWKGSVWDSDFCQIAALQHVRYSIRNRSCLLNVDIDELVITKNRRSIFDIAAKSNRSVCYFKGRSVYIEKVEMEKVLATRHLQHNLLDEESVYPNKYIVDLSKITDDSFLFPHEVTDAKDVIESNKVEYLHYMNISNNWKYNRDNHILYNAEIHQRISLRPLFEDAQNPNTHNDIYSENLSTSFIDYLTSKMKKRIQKILK